MLAPSTPLDPSALVRFLWSADDLPDLRLFERLVRVVPLLVTRLQEVPQTQKRAAPLAVLPELVVAHDSSEIDEHGRDCPSDAGPLRSSHARGYLTHWAVARSFDGALHGAVDAWAWTRSWTLRKQDHHERVVAEKESSKWDRGIVRAERLLCGAGFRGVLWHVADKEADIFEHQVHQKQAGRHVILRCDLGRQPTVWVGKKKVALETYLANVPVAATLERSVDSRVRDKARGLTHRERPATLEIRAPHEDLWA